MDTGLLERDATAKWDELETWAAPAEEKRARWGAALAVMGGGILIVVAAVIVAGTGLRHDSRPAQASPAAATATAAETAPSFPDVGVASTSYVPGHSSGWHVHPGVHSAVVLSGTLTVYGADCSRQDYAAGQTYLGGRDAHIVRNESAEPVDLVVTYVFQTTSPLEHATVVPAPAGCNVR